MASKKPLAAAPGAGPTHETPTHFARLVPFGAVSQRRAPRLTGQHLGSLAILRLAAPGNQATSNHVRHIAAAHGPLSDPGRWVAAPSRARSLY